MCWVQDRVRDLRATRPDPTLKLLSHRQPNQKLRPPNQGECNTLGHHHLDLQVEYLYLRPQRSDQLLRKSPEERRPQRRLRMSGELLRRGQRKLEPHKRLLEERYPQTQTPASYLKHLKKRSGNHLYHHLREMNPTSCGTRFTFKSYLIMVEVYYTPVMVPSNLLLLSCCHSGYRGNASPQHYISMGC